MLTDLPAASAEDTETPEQAPRGALIEIALTVLVAAAAVLFASFLAVASGIA